MQGVSQLAHVAGKGVAVGAKLFDAFWLLVRSC